MLGFIFENQPRHTCDGGIQDGASMELRFVVSNYSALALMLDRKISWNMGDILC